MSGFANEKTLNRGPVWGGYRGVRNKSTNNQYSSGSIGRRFATDSLCINVQNFERGSVPGRKQSMAGAHNSSSSGVRTSECGLAGTSGVYCQKMGKGSEMKTLVTAIQKGGQGKTFATCHLALDFK